MTKSSPRIKFDSLNNKTKIILSVLFLFLIFLCFFIVYQYKTNRQDTKTLQSKIDNLILQNKYEEALEELQNLKETESTKEFICSRKGRIYFLKKDFDKALDSYKKCEEIFDSKKEASKKSYYLNLMGNSYREKREPKKAILYYNKAVEINPKNQTAWVNLVNIYIISGERSDALKTVKMALEKIPNDPALLKLLEKLE